MPVQKIKVIIDTNIFISFLIGKELDKLKHLLVSPDLVLITTEQLFLEIKMVTSRPKLQKYFNQVKVDELINFLRLISVNVSISEIKQICRDPKDDFLLALAETSVANFIITGDKDLLELKSIGQTRIISPKELDKVF